MEKVCKYCGNVLNISTEEFVQPDKNRYAHVECYESFLAFEESLMQEPVKAKPAPTKEAICYYCKETFKLEPGAYFSPVINRYAHNSCGEKYATEDDKYRDMIYSVLRKAGVDYNFGMCERQRLRYLKEGYTNKGIAYSLDYFYKKKNGDPKKAQGGIGIVPYVYEEMYSYYVQQEKRKMALQQAEELPDAVVVKLPDKKEKKKKATFNLEDIDG